MAMLWNGIALTPARIDLAPPAGGYAYYASITIDHNQVTADLADFPMLFIGTYDGTGGEPDLRTVANGGNVQNTATGKGPTSPTVPADLVFSPNTGGSSPYDFEVERYNATTGELVAWVRVPAVSSAVDTVFYLVYGDAAVTASQEDPVNVWDTDFLGVWHKVSNATKLGFAANGGYAYPVHAPTINPAAYYYNGVTYVAWQSGGGEPYVATYTHAGGTWSDPVLAGTNPLVNDHHGAPAIIVDNSGYIHLFYGSHSTAIEHTRSTNPEDISAWTAQADIGAAESYPNLVKQSDGTLLMIERQTSGGLFPIRYTTSADWTVFNTIISLADAGDVAYYSEAIYDADNDRVYLAWYWWDSSAGKRLNIYCAYLDMADGHMYSVSGTDLGTSISDAEMAANCLVINSGVYETQTPILFLDSSQRPHLIYAINSATGYKYQYTGWDGAAWSAAVDIVATGNYYAWGTAFYDGTDIEAYLPVQASGVQGEAIQHWRKTGGAWSKVVDILSPTNRICHAGFQYVHRVVNGLDALRVIFCDWTNGDYGPTDLELFAVDSSDAFVPKSGTVTGLVGDSAGAAYHGTKKAAGEPASSASGRAGDAQDYDGSDDCISFDVFPSPTAQVTVEVWIKTPGYAEGDLDFIVDRLGVTEGYGLYLSTTNKIAMGINGGFGTATGTTSVNDDAWHYAVGTYNKDLGGTQEIKVFVDGTPAEGTADYSTAIDYSPEPNKYFGGRAATYNFDGLIDEVRISSTVRSNAYIDATYVNINTPATFYTVGAET